MDKNIYDIIGRELRGVASESEKGNLADWRDESEYNESLFKSLSVIWVKYEFLPKLKDIDIDSAWSRQLSLRHEQKSNRSTYTWVAVAASVILLIGAFYLLVLMRSPMYESGNEVLSEMSLPDGSSIWLNKHSSLDYKESEGRRSVVLDGEAFFDVLRDESSPFVIATAQLKTKVLGTSFNVKYRDNQSIVTVYSGVVEVSDNDHKMILQKGMSISYDHIENQLIENSDTLNVLSWKTGILTFRDTPLPTVLRHIETHYDVKFKDNMSDSNSRITALFDHKDLSEVILTLEMISEEKLNIDSNE